MSRGGASKTIGGAVVAWRSEPEKEGHHQRPEDYERIHEHRRRASHIGRQGFASPINLSGTIVGSLLGTAHIMSAVG